MGGELNLDLNFLFLFLVDFDDFLPLGLKGLNVFVGLGFFLSLFGLRLDLAKLLEVFLADRNAYGFGQEILFLEFSFGSLLESLEVENRLDEFLGANVVGLGLLGLGNELDFVLEEFNGRLYEMALDELVGHFGLGGNSKFEFLGLLQEVLEGGDCVFLLFAYLDFLKEVFGLQSEALLYVVMS